MHISSDSARPGEVAREVRSDGGNASAGAARGYVHTVRPVGSLIGDRFVVKAHLGRGRSGERYEAIDRSLSDPDLSSERCVVLHFLNARVARQARVLQKLEASYQQPHLWAHRNLFSVLGFGSDHGEYFFVTEELEGGTLRTILDEVAPEVPSEEETFGVLAGIGDALKYAHAKGVVHGDIRPENVFVTKDLVVKVLDLLPATLPRTVPLFPEDNAAHGPAVPNPRDDVYGLACVAYELFAGKHPFNSNTALEALAAGLKPVPIPRLDARSWDALVRGLALRRDQRTPSVAAFLADLGVTGRERLRREGEASRGPATSSAAPVTAVPDDGTDWDLGDRTVATPRVSPRAARAPELIEPDVDHHYELFRIRRDTESGRARRKLPWLVALALGIGAAVYFDSAWLRARAPEWLAMGRDLADSVMAQGKRTMAPSVDGDPTVAPADVAPSSTGRLGSAVSSTGSAQTSAASSEPKDASAQSKDASASPKDASAQQKGAGAPAKAVTPPPKDASPPPQDTVANARDGASASAATAQPPTAAASPSQSTQVKQAPVAGQPAAVETFEPEKPVVVVSEAAPSAAITIRRRGGLDAATSFVWWTSDGTAVADEDYINFGARIERLAAGEQSRTIHIPIVNDSKREGRESFYVNVRASQDKRDEPPQRVEVVINDDD